MTNGNAPDRVTRSSPDHAPEPGPKGLRWRRLAWFVGIWAGTALAVILFSYFMRALIGL